eukprot:6060829-Ditylum_brightwellii.AAC.1
MVCASIGFVSIYHHSGSYIIFICHGGTVLGDSKFVEDGAEILGHLCCGNTLDKLSLCGACGD